MRDRLAYARFLADGLLRRYWRYLFGAYLLIGGALAVSYAIEGQWLIAGLIVVVVALYMTIDQFREITRTEREAP